MIKVIAGAINNPSSGRSLEEFHRYWGERHGPLFARTPELRRYVQHHTLPDAYPGEPRPTHDGASMFWYDNLEALRQPNRSPLLANVIYEHDGELYDWYVRSARYGPPESMTLSDTVRADDRQLFDRVADWPVDHKRTSVVAEERVVIDGATTPSMVKAIFTAARRPGISLAEFSMHWFDVHGELGSRLPGLRRYVQNHALPEAYAVRGLTHDGFSELWFDDLPSLQAARRSREWQALSDDGARLFGQPMSVVIARERIIKAGTL